MPCPYTCIQHSPANHPVLTSPFQIWNHPDVLNRIVQQRRVADDNDLDLEVGPIDGEDKGAKKGKGAGGSKTQSPAASAAPSPAPSDSMSCVSSRPPSSLMTDTTEAPTPTPFADRAGRDPVITFEWVSTLLAIGVLLLY